MNRNYKDAERKPGGGQFPCYSERSSRARDTRESKQNIWKINQGEEKARQMTRGNL